MFEIASLTFLLLLSLSGCTAFKVNDARISESLSVHSVSCESPYELVRDCADDFVPTFTIRIENQEMRIASNASGDIIYFGQTFSASMGSAVLDGLSLGTTDPMGHKLAEFFNVIEATLERTGINLVEATPVILPQFHIKTGEMGDTWGYILELDGDGRSVLDEYAVKVDSSNAVNKE